METIANTTIPRISSLDVRQLSSIKAYKSLLAILLEWIIIIGAILLHITFQNPLAYLLVYVIISTRLYALYSLIHEAIHHLIVKNKQVNDIISQLFLGIPLFINLRAMRDRHFAHHKYLFTDKDPEMKLLAYNEFVFPKSASSIIKIIILDLTGINFIKYKLLKLRSLIEQGQLLKSLADQKMSVLLIGAFLITAFYFKIMDELFLYWLFPYATLYQLLNRLRLSTEHFNIQDEKLIKTRSIVPNWFQKLTIIPYNLGYHTEHHLYPGVPFYNLPKLQKVLLQDKEFSAHATIEHGFLSISNQYIK